MVLWLLRLSLVSALFSFASFAQGTDGCADLLNPAYLKDLSGGGKAGVLRVESLLGWQVPVWDVSDHVVETRAKEDPKLRIANLTHVFQSGVPFLGFGRPNVYLAIPGQDSVGLGYVKVSAKSLYRGDTTIDRTLDRVQSGILMTFPELDQEAVNRLYEASKKYEGTRRVTCVNTNCRILADAGFSIGGDSLRGYYFPVPLLSDILRYGLQFNGRPVKFDLIKTTPQYLEDIGLSITHSVATTLCRHTERACAPIIKNIERNSLVIRINDGLKSTLGLAILQPKNNAPIERPRWEAQPTRILVPQDLQRNYNLEVSEPSQFGVLLRMIWGPHALFEIPIARNIVDEFLPETLDAFPKENPGFSTRLKRDYLFAPFMIDYFRAHLADNYRKIEGLNQTQLLDMIRTDSPEFPNRYNFVVLGDRIIIMKLDIKNSMVDWVLAKHVLLSGYSKDVRFAGEIWKSADGTIHLNANSGTYQPLEELYPMLKQLFERLFPGVACVTEAVPK